MQYNIAGGIDLSNYYFGCGTVFETEMLYFGHVGRKKVGSPVLRLKSLACLMGYNF